MPSSLSLQINPSRTHWQKERLQTNFQQTANKRSLIHTAKKQSQINFQSTAKKQSRFTSSHRPAHTTIRVSHANATQRPSSSTYTTIRQQQPTAPTHISRQLPRERQNGMLTKSGRTITPRVNDTRGDTPTSRTSHPHTDDNDDQEGFDAFFQERFGSGATTVFDKETRTRAGPSLPLEHSRSPSTSRSLTLTININITHTHHQHQHHSRVPSTSPRYLLLSTSHSLDKA